MDAISIILTILLTLIYFSIEIYYYFKYKNEVDMRINDKKFQIQFIVLMAFTLIAVVCWVIFDLNYFIMPFWFAIILFGYNIISYLIMTQGFLSSQQMKLKIEKNPQKMAFFVGILIVFIFFITYSLINQAVLLGAVFETADWFSQTFLDMLQSDNIAGIVALMTIGSFTIIIAKARRSNAFAVAGFFLIIALPIFSVFDTLFTDIENIQYIAPDLYDAFQNEGLAIIIYAVILIMFYVLLVSIIIGFLSMIDSVQIGDDD